MEDRYHTKYEAEEIDKLLENASAAVMYKPQTLTPEEKAQARENIGVTGYYSTKREEIGVEHDDINSKYIWGLYDALMAEPPGKVKKLVWVEEIKEWKISVRTEEPNEDGNWKEIVLNKDGESVEYTLTAGAFVNYEYVISTGDHNEEDKGKYPERDLDIKKPKYLILSGIHGTEWPAVFSTYRFAKDLLSGESTISPLLEGAVIHILPVGTPDGFDAFTYENANGVNINRNFAADVFEKETQAITNWVKVNTDADLFIDHHNGGTTHEVTMLVGAPDNQAVDTAKRIALRGLDRIIPYWRDVIGYSKTLLDHNNTPQDVVFSYSMSKDMPSSATQYAVEKYGVTSLALETSVYQNGNYSDYKQDEKVCTPETVAAGAEALGNILIEVYEQAFFGEVVDDMKAIDNKLDILMEAVNSTINFNITGEQPSSCTHDCSTCGGCH